MQSFILFRKPNETKIELQKLALTTKETANQFIFHSFDNTAHLQFNIESSKEISTEEIKLLKINLYKETEPNYICNQQEYLDLCDFFIEELKAERFKKLILSRIKKVEPFIPTEKFLSLTKQYPQAFVYLFHNNQQTWIGATPERLIKVKNNHLETVALAGTKSVNENRKWTHKEIEEHQFVIDYIVKALKNFNPKIEPTQSIQLNQIEHLKTPISAQLPHNTCIKEIVNQLHPTPAVCGIPKNDAMKFIIKNEPHQRNFYCGFLGFKQADYSEFFVNLRCAELFSDYALLYIGGGITTKSNALYEWNETELKATALL